MDVRVGEFIAAAGACGAEVLRFEGPQGALDYIARFLEENSQPSLLIAADVLEHFSGAERFSSSMLQAKDDWLTAEVGLVRADYGVAETGTLIHLDRSEEERLIWTLPSLCFCLLGEEKIVRRLEELAPAVDSHLGRLDLPSPNVSLVTGPSRTADIEGQLVCGVHGPRRVIVLLLASKASLTDENN